MLYKENKGSRMDFQRLLLFLIYNIRKYKKGQRKNMYDEELRKKVKLLKATDGIKSYYELAELLGMANGSFYNWLRGSYDLGTDKRTQLKQIIEDLYIPL